MPIKAPPEVNKTTQKLSLANSPGLKDHFHEQDAVAAQTAKLRALRLAKEQAEAPAAKEAPKKKRAAPKPPAMRRGIGSA